MEKKTIYKLVEPYKIIPETSLLEISKLDDNAVYAETVYSVISKGTELSAWKGLPGLRVDYDYPRLLGYCNLAQIMKVGQGIKHLQQGDLILTHQPHCSAFVCREGDILLKFVQTNPKMLKKLTTCYIYYLAYYSLLRGGFKPGYHVAVIGFGPIGYAISILVTVFGGKPIIFTNQKFNEKKLNQIHCSQFFSKNSSQEELTHNKVNNFDLVMNTTNLWQDHLLAMQISKNNGEIVCLGFPGREEKSIYLNPLDSRYFYGKSLTIKHCGYPKGLKNNNPEDFDSAYRGMNYIADLILENKIEMDSIIGFECSWTELDMAYRKLDENAMGFTTGLIVW